MKRFLGAAAFLVLAIFVWRWAATRSNSLTVYCAHDAIFADGILQKFSAETGVAVRVKYDTEATKSLALAELLLREKAAPRADVFWDNELLGMADLQAAGVLEPYAGAGWARIPARWKDDAGAWTGFAARLRVVIYDPEKITDPASRPQVTDAKKWAVAKPLYGTTLTHFSVLWSRWGATRTREWRAEMQRAGWHELNGNAAVKDAVVAGSCAAGLVDSDDFFEALDAGKKVAFLPVITDDGATICIPNSVAIIRGSHHRAAAEKLVDFLLSERIELELAHSASRQIPLGPTALEALPADVRALEKFAQTSVPLKELTSARRACLAWLKNAEMP